MTRKVSAVQRDARRQRVAVNLLAGLNYREIAGALKVSPATVCRDTKAILGEWREARLETTDEWVALQVKRLDRAINAIWDSVLNGDVNAIDRLQRLIDQQGKLLGHTADKMEHTGVNGGAIPVAFINYRQGLKSSDDSTDA